MGEEERAGMGSVGEGILAGCVGEVNVELCCGGSTLQQGTVQALPSEGRQGRTDKSGGVRQQTPPGQDTPTFNDLMMNV